MSKGRKSLIYVMSNSHAVRGRSAGEEIESQISYVHESRRSSRVCTNRRESAAPRRTPGSKPRNIIFILTDDHRYDAIGFMKGQNFLETPFLDSLARDGAHIKNAFVTTALCSPVAHPSSPASMRISIRSWTTTRRFRAGQRSSRNIYSKQDTRPDFSGSGIWARRATTRNRASTAGSVSAVRARTCQAETGSTSTASMSRKRDTSPTNSQIMRSTG